MRCASRIEKGLAGAGGVAEAHANYGTKRATASSTTHHRYPRLRGHVITGLGYSVPRRAPGVSIPTARSCGTSAPWLYAFHRASTIPVLLISMVPAFQFDNWQWLALQLATPVVLWGAWPFHRAAWLNLRHGAATMDTLISLGTLAAWLWSLYALFLGDAGEPGMKMAVNLVPDQGAGRTRSTSRSPRS